MRSDRSACWRDPHRKTPWLRMKEMFRRDWEQIRNDLENGDPAEDCWYSCNSNVLYAPDIPTFEEVEPAYRFGYVARQQYVRHLSMWNEDLECQLEHEWQNTHPNDMYSWSRFKCAVRRGWDYREPERTYSFGEALLEGRNN